MRRDEAANIDLLVSRKVDGLIIASAQRNAKAFKALKTPYALIDRQVPGLKANYVGTKNEDIGFLATQPSDRAGLPADRASEGAGAFHRRRPLARISPALAKHGLAAQATWSSRRAMTMPADIRR